MMDDAENDPEFEPRLDLLTKANPVDKPEEKPTPEELKEWCYAA